jgi:hypothetical protein
MKFPPLLLLGVLILAAVGMTAYKAFSTTESGVVVAGHPTDLPYVPAPGAPTPGPTPTPIAPPADSALISEEKAAELLTKWAEGYGTLSSSPFESVEAQAGDYEGDFPLLAPDYPLRIVTGAGTFHPRSAPPGTQLTEYGRISIWIDAITGAVLSVQLSDQQSGPE